VGTRKKFTHFNVGSFNLHHESAYASCGEALKAIKLTPKLANGRFFREQEEQSLFNNACKNAGNLLAEYKLS